MTEQKKTGWLFYPPLAAILLVFLGANLGAVRQLWGLNFFKFLSPVLLYVAAALLVIVAVPPVSSGLFRLLGKLSHHEDARGRRLTMYGLVLSALVTVLAFLFPSATQLLGDGHLRLNQVISGDLLLPTEFLDFLLHSVFYSAVLKPLGFTAYHSYYLISAICGFAFIFGVFRLARYLAGEQVWVSFLLMASSGVLVQFFGYVESYAMIAALLPFIFLTGLKAVEGKTPVMKYILLCVAGALIHSLALVIFLPSVVLVLLRGRPALQNKEKRATVILTVATLILIIAAYVARAVGIDVLGRHVIPLFGEPGHTLGLFTLAHLSDLFNWLFLCSLPVLFFILYGLVRWRTLHPSRNPQSLYALWIIIPSVFFLLFFSPKLGGPRDWDLFALPAFLLIPSLIVLCLSSERTPLPSQTIPVALLSLVLTASFVAVNSRAEASFDRFEEVIEVARFKNLTKEYRVLTVAAGEYPWLRHRQLDYLLKAWQEPPPTLGDSIDVLRGLGLIYVSRRDKELAYDNLSRALELDTLNLGGHQNLLLYVQIFGNKQEMLEMARLVERRFAENAKALVTAGVAYWKADDYESKARCFERAYQLDDDDFMVVLGYGRHLVEIEEYQQAIEILGRAIEMDPKSFLGHHLTATAYKGLGEVEKARESLAIARSLQRTPSEARQVETLEDSLK